MLKNWKKYSWKVVGVFIIGIFTTWAGFAARPLLSVAETLWRGLIKVATLGVPLWLLLIVALVSWGLIKIVKTIQVSTVDSSKPLWVTQYTTDIIGGVLWVWRYTPNYDGLWSVDGEYLESLCPRCKGTVEVRRTSSWTQVLFCPRCNSTVSTDFSTSYREYQYNTINEIRRRIRAREWEQSPNRVQNLAN